MSQARERTSVGREIWSGLEDQTVGWRTTAEHQGNDGRRGALHAGRKETWRGQGNGEQYVRDE